MYRYNGDTQWTLVGDAPHGITRVCALQVYGGHLYAGTGSEAKVLRYEGAREWSDCGEVVCGEEYQVREVNDLTVYNGRLYAGSMPKGEVYRYDGDGCWTLIKRLVEDGGMPPKTTSHYRRVSCLTSFDGQLYAGTGTYRGVADYTAHPQVGRRIDDLRLYGRALNGGQIADISRRSI